MEQQQQRPRQPGQEPTSGLQCSGQEQQHQQQLQQQRQLQDQGGGGGLPYDRPLNREPSPPPPPQGLNGARRLRQHPHQRSPSLPTTASPAAEELQRRFAHRPSLVGRALNAAGVSSAPNLRRASSLLSSAPPPGSSASAPEETFSLNLEDYELGNVIGYGGSSVVRIATYKPFDRKVAVKVIDLDRFERNQIDELRRETQVMSLCRHAHLLRVYGSFVTGSKLYIIMPFLSAGSCLDIMKFAYPEGLDEVYIATILKQALLGLEYLHRTGHIHRDVKAGNLLMDQDGRVLLADFGVSSTLNDHGDRRGRRTTFVGTPCWMAPEVMEQSGYDYKADIWSFGITALELAKGHAPFSKYPPLKVVMLTLTNDPPTLEREHARHKYSKAFKELIDMCLQKDPSKRPTAERLLQHPFFKQAKKPQHLISLVQSIPPIQDRPAKKQLLKSASSSNGMSWDFSNIGVDDEQEGGG